MAKIKKERQMVFSSENVTEATDKINDGIVLKRFQNPWLKNEIGLRRSGLTFKMTSAEQGEYVKCALDIHHFTEKYCKVKREDGSIGAITLRDYQADILDNFVDNRFNILMASRQVGKCNSLIIKVLCKITENNKTNEVEIPMYKLLFIYKKNRTISDYVKYGIYSIISLLT